MTPGAAGTGGSAGIAGPRATLSLFVWGWYLAALGVALLITPNLVLTTFSTSLNYLKDSFIHRGKRAAP